MRDNRYIRIFLSSTFEDLQPERDYLITKVFPRLRDIARQRDVALVPIDLRWGVNTSDVIQTCFDEISNSRPFFIGIIGQRYGWCPSIEDLHANERLDELYGEEIKHYIKEGMSITEMEMQYGVLQLPDETKKGTTAYFYIKDCDIADGKLIRLRDKVRNNGFFPVASFTTPEELGEQVERDFMQMLDARYPNRPLTDFEREHRAQEVYRNSLLELYCVYQPSIDKLTNWLSGDKQFGYFTWEARDGLSARFSYWIKQLEDEGIYHVIYHFVGIADDYNPDHALLHITNEMRQLYGLPTLPYSESLNASKGLQDIINNPLNTKKILLVLDGMHKKAPSDLATIQEKQEWHIPTTLPSNMKMLFYDQNYASGTIPYENTESLDLSDQYSKVDDFCEHRKRFINSYLSYYRKHLDESIVANIITGTTSWRLPDIKVLLNLIINYGHYNTLEQYLDSYLNIDPEKFYALVLNRYKHDFGEAVVERTLYLLLASSNGLTEEELIAIISITQLQWSQFYCAFKDNLRLIKDRLVIANPKLFGLNNSEKLCDARKSIINYYTSFKPVPPHFAPEIVYQYFQLGDHEQLHKWLTNGRVVIAMDNFSTERFIKYWMYLQSIPNTNYSFREYLNCHLENPKEQKVLLNKLAIIARSLGDFQLARDFTQLWADLGENNGHSSISLQYNNIATSYYLCGQFRQAIECMLLSLEHQRKATGKYSPEYAERAINLGNMYSRIKEYDKAKEYVLPALQLLKGKDPFAYSLAIGYSIIGDIAWWRDDTDEAMEMHAKAIDILKEHKMYVSEDGAYILEKLYYDFRMKGDWGFTDRFQSNSKTLNLLREAVDILTQVLGANAAKTLMMRTTLITAEADLGRTPLDKLVRELEENLTIVKQLRGNYRWLEAAYYQAFHEVYEAYEVEDEADYYLKLAEEYRQM